MGQKSTILAIVLIIFAVIFAIVFVVRGILSLGGKEDKPKPNPETDRKIVAVADIVYNPLVYEGQNVQINSSITDWITNKSFVFAATTSRFGGNPKQLLVVYKNPFPLPESTTGKQLGLGEKVPVVAKGKVSILNREELQSLLGVSLDSSELALDNNPLISGWKEGVVIELESVEKQE